MQPSLQSVARWLAASRTPIVAFGQTVFWDEPLKAVLLAAVRAESPDLPFTLGIHDVDYFSKLPGHRARTGEPPFALVTRNDGTTRELWAAVAELARLWGSETPVTLADYQTAHVPIASLARASNTPAEFIDSATEASGWRAVAYVGDAQPLACALRAAELLPTLRKLWQWGIDETIALWVVPSRRVAARARGARLMSLLEPANDPGYGDCPPSDESVTCLYRRLLPQLLAAITGERPNGLAVSSTLAHFQFNPRTAAFPRFAPVQKYLDPETCDLCLAAYDRAVAGTGIYHLDRFGPGALPFDAVIPGRGRATLRLTEHQVWLRFPDRDQRVGSLAKPGLDALAALLDAQCGPGAALVGKALMLPVMICGEAALALSETASAYLPRTQQWVREVAAAGIAFDLKPLVRLNYPTFDALESCELGQINAYDRGVGWRDTVAAQQALLDWLATHSGRDDLLAWLEASRGSEWTVVRQRFFEVRDELRQAGDRINALRARIRQLHRQRSELAVSIRAIERVCRELKATPAMGVGRVEALRQRAAAVAEIGGLRAEIGAAAQAIQQEMRAIATAKLPEQRAHLTQQVDLARLELTRVAVGVVRGLPRANHRPCAWWLPLLDESGAWYRALADGTEARCEPWT